ncbi:hypothetical protein GTU79_07055 [Sodalis ligni]|uniref:hypothetical protein n=1 Tax=Sodalis ligni TaxID=2697027 RepID=UPI001BDE4770|nr:hypothetical protein [Sodalis ligni]QWA12488.1 hypothetical protein GTU79_07055 [Sodalis ligni]
MKQTRDDLIYIAGKAGVGDKFSSQINHFMSLIEEPDFIADENKEMVYGQLGRFLELLSNIDKEKFSYIFKDIIENMFAGLDVCTTGAISNISNACTRVKYHTGGGTLNKCKDFRNNLIISLVANFVRHHHGSKSEEMEIHYANAYQQLLEDTEWSIGAPVTDIFISQDQKNLIKINFNYLKEDLFRLSRI